MEETEQERNERQLGELLQEARVAMPGVQVLFAFLLAVPFQQGFEKTTAFQKDVYLVTVLLAAATALCFIAPTAYHRIQFERGEKRHLIHIANRFLVAGLAFLSLAMTAAVLLVSDYLFSDATSIAVSTTLAVAFAGFWFVYPLSRRLRGERAAVSSAAQRDDG